MTATRFVPSPRSPAAKGYRGPAMEGFIARWYTKTRSSPSQLAQWRREARALTGAPARGATVLEVAPGPGFLSIEIARAGPFRVTGVDISRTFVEIATENARRAGVPVTFLEGNASRLPLPPESFDLVVCQAAFKNFSEPREALQEFYRVLRPGGCARVQDMRKDATDAEIGDEVRSMRLGPSRSFLTHRALVGLRRRAYTREQFGRMAEESAFHGGETSLTGIGLDLRLRKGPAGSGSLIVGQKTP